MSYNAGMIFEDLGLLFFTALIFSLFLTPASISFAQKIGAMDSPASMGSDSIDLD